MTNQDVFFIGVTRFSLYIPGSASWNLSRDTTEEQYLAALYDPERLDARLDIFLNVSLPQLQNATKNHKVKHVVQYSSSLPQQYQTALREAERKYQFLEIFCNDSREQHSKIIDDSADKFAAELGYEDYTYAWYRLDDDDILSSTYFTQVEKYVTEANAGSVVSLGLGYSAIYHGGRLWNVREDYRPKSSIGQLYVCSFKSSTNTRTEPPRQNHALIDKWAPTILDSREHSFITVLHANQDGHLRGDGAEAFAKLDSEQARRPYLLEIPKFKPSFDAIEANRFGKVTTIVDARGTSNNEAITIGTSPRVIPISPAQSLSVDFDVSPQAAQPDARFFVALEFNPSECPNPSGRWQQYDANTLVCGFPLAKLSVLDRAAYLSVNSDVKVKNIKFWHSRNLNSPLTLRFARIVQH